MGVQESNFGGLDYAQIIIKIKIEQKEKKKNSNCLYFFESASRTRLLSPPFSYTIKTRKR